LSKKLTKGIHPKSHIECSAIWYDYIGCAGIKVYVMPLQIKPTLFFVKPDMSYLSIIKAFTRKTMVVRIKRDLKSGEYLYTFPSISA
jgi:hypothetical protein